MQNKKEDVAIVPDTNVLASEFWEMFKDLENVYLPRAVLEEIEFNYLISRMLAESSKTIVCIRDGRFVMIRLLELKEEDEKGISAIFKTRVYPYRETVTDRLLADLDLEKSRNGHSNYYYRILAKIKTQMPRKRSVHQSNGQELEEKKAKEKEFKVIRKAFLKANSVYPQILDLINTGKWILIGSKGSGLKQLLEETFQGFNSELTGERGETGIGLNDIRILSSALNLAIDGKEVVFLTTDNHLAMTWGMHEQEVKAKIGKKIDFKVQRLKFKNHDRS